jgi:hypothetical protein
MTLNTEQLSFRLRERLSEPAMLDLTKRLIAIPSENPPGNHYEECARTLCDELDRLGFDDVRREGACVLASAETGPRTRNGSAVGGDGWLDADPEIRNLKPDIYAVNEDGDVGGKRGYCEALGIEYLVLKRIPAPGLPKRTSTDLRGS